MKRHSFLLLLVAAGAAAKAQLTIQSGATLYIESGAKVTVQGDLTSSASIQGSGTVAMKGSALQNITMNGFVIPNLEIDNTANVTLNGSSAKIGTNLLFTNGKLLTGGQDLTIASAATITGNNASRFIWTDGTGQVRKELTTDVAAYEIPVGVNNDYRPVYLTSTGGSYSTANVGVRCVTGASANKPPMMANYLATYWPVTKTGITGGTQTLSGQYVDPSDVSGTESTLAGYFFNGTDWSSAGETHDNSANRIAMNIGAASGELTGMNKFIAVGSRAFLQGAYNSATGLMSDALRTGGNVIPVNDPYRSTPYNSSFTHVANTTPEMVSASVFSDQAIADNNIVDWVFLELRNNASPGNTVLQTRSALLQRDGDIVDIDGVSPVTFNNVANGSYTIAVRHRNHLGLSTTPVTPRTFSETKSTAFSTNVADLRNASTALFGTAGTNYATASHPTLTTINMLWAGNVNANTSSSYQGPGNDRASLLTDLSGNQLSSLTNGYYRADINFNRIVNFQGPSNDRAYLLSTILSSNELTARTQSLPQ